MGAVMYFTGAPTIPRYIELSKSADWN